MSRMCVQQQVLHLVRQRSPHNPSSGCTHMLAVAQRCLFLRAQLEQEQLLASWQL